MKDLLQRFRTWWAARAERERDILSAGAVAFALLMAWMAVWEPLTGMRHRRQVALADARTLAVQLETLAAESRGGAGGASAGSRQQSLASVIDQSGKSSGIGKTPTLQPDGDNAVRVGFEDVPFDAVIRWLGDLRTRHGVQVSDAQIERESASGLVNARMTLVRP